MKLTVAYDAASMERARQIQFWPTALKIRLREALVASLSDLHLAAVSEMDTLFLNPSGELAGSLKESPYSELEGDLYTLDPKAFRREYGFSGKTDRLGRYYANDPGISYMHLAVDDSYVYIQNNYELAIIKAFHDIGVA